MLPRAAVSLLVIAGLARSAWSEIEVHATCGSEVANAPVLARTLEAEITRALDDLPATSRYTVDVSLVHLDVTTDRAEIEARAEIYAMLSDDRGRVVWTSLSRSVARGTPADRSQLARDAVQAAAARVGRLLRRRLRT